MAGNLTPAWLAKRGTSRGGLLPFLVLLFFLSGGSGLIYQVLWLRLLGLVFGVTVHAAATTLASFMAGLALGSLAAGRLADRARSPLAWFGAAEILVGLTALASPLALGLLERLYVAAYPLLPQALGPLTLVRFLFASAVLLVPTTLMGASLPLVAKSALLRGGDAGERIGLLYAANTAGAIGGTLLAGFYLIGGVGIGASFKLAATINVLVGIAALALARTGGRRHPAPHLDAEVGGAAARPPGAGPPAAGLPSRARQLVLLVFAVSGFASLALEIVWFRVLILYLSVTTYAFTFMLATVLGGIAAGSALVAWPLRRWPGTPWRWLARLAAIELALSVASALSLAVLAYTPAALERAAPLLGRATPRGLAMSLIASFLALFPATLLMGLAFPIGLHLWVAGTGGADARAGERLGRFYSLNVCGAILGSVVAGFLLLPRLGGRGSLVALAALALLSGLLLLAALPPAWRASAPGVGLAGTALFLGTALLAPDPYVAALSRRYPGEQLLWREEDPQLTVSVHRREDGVTLLYVDGIHQADDSPAMLRFHRLLGQLPLALHPDPQRALVIGLGGGATAGAMSRQVGVEIDVVELSTALVRGADQLPHVNNDVLRQPNVRLRMDDGRNYLLLTSQRYDVITADIIRPFHAGAGSLYSAEYFRLAHDALADDGLMAQWVDTSSETQYRLIVRTFQSVFPHTTAWADGGLLIGSKGPLRLDPEGDARRLRDPATREALEALDLGSTDALLSLCTAGPEEVRRFAGPGPLLTDDRPLIEYFLTLPRGDRPVDLARLRGVEGEHKGCPIAPDPGAARSEAGRSRGRSGTPNGVARCPAPLPVGPAAAR